MRRSPTISTYISSITLGLILIFQNTVNSQEKKQIEFINSTYLGNKTRNYYGDVAPEKLNVLWQKNLGDRVGRTNQPLLFKEDNQLFIIQGGANKLIKKIDATNGDLIWEYHFNNSINSTGSLWQDKEIDDEILSYQLIQGGKSGLSKNNRADSAESLRAISLISGEEIWRYNVRKTACYSRDVDGSCLIHHDSLYIGLENGLLAIMNPHINSLSKGKHPKSFIDLPLYNDSDIILHNHNLIVESSPAKLDDHIYIGSGSGHIYGYNINSKKIDWDYYIGADIDASTVITNDNCIIIGFEKQFIDGHGGVMKIDPKASKDDCVKWFLPVIGTLSNKWQGGVVGSVGIDDYYNSNDNIAAIVGLNGYLYLVKHKKLSSNIAKGPSNKSTFPTPEIIFKKQIGISISTPLIVKDKIIIATSKGIWLFKIASNEIILLDFFEEDFEATPAVFAGKIYIASTKGTLYCFGG